MTEKLDPFSDLHQALVHLVRSLVNHPTQASVTPITKASETVLLISVTREDFGQIIGKSGHTIRAIRTLAYACSQARGRHVRVDVEEQLD